MDNVKFTGNYPGIPAVVTPEVAEWLKANHPRYDEFKPVIDERLKLHKGDMAAVEAALKEQKKEADAKSEDDNKKPEDKAHAKPAGSKPAENESGGNK